MADDNETPNRSEAALDLDVLQSIVEIIGADEPSVIVDLLDTFLVDSQRQIDEMQRSLADGDIKNVHRLAHSMKSSSSTFGAMPLSRRCEVLERTARDGCGDGSCPEKLALLVAAHA